jgi:uncharacterized integral membrane protein (TIGR00698 family)
MDEAVIDPPELVGPLPAESSAIWSGLLLCGGIAVAAVGLHQLPVFGVLSPMIIAVMIGMGLRNSVGLAERARAGIGFALRRILRLAIILLGLQLTFAQIAEVGFSGLFIVVTVLISTFLVAKWLGRVLGVDERLAELIGAGTAVCGASAVIAMNTVTRGQDEDAAYAVACVTLYGTVAMFLYPILRGYLGLDSTAYGLWSGASIHEIAQVIGATFQAGAEAGHIGTVTKLSRVMLLAPLVLGTGLWRYRRRKGTSTAAARPPIPWFVLGFVFLTAVNSVIAVPKSVTVSLAQLTTFLLSIALGAMGLEADIGKLRRKGIRPLVLAAATWLFIASFSYVLIISVR